MPSSASLARLVLAASLVAACAPKADQPPAASPDSMAASAMTANADQDFLRMLSDHHKGLVAMAHLSVEGEKKGSAAVQADAQQLDRAQDAELDSMVTMLEQQFKDPYAPKVTPDDAAMRDALNAQTGAAYDRAFYTSVVKHHQKGLRMIDDLLPKLQRTDVRAMAQRMRAEQAQEIAAFQRKIGGG